MGLDAKSWEVMPGVWVWLASRHAVARGEWDALYRQMEPRRQARCDRYARPADAQRCILADALTRLALSTLSGRAPQTLSFETRPGGKPYVPGLGVEFSLSHSGELALCAAAHFPVGADLQRARPLSPSLTKKMARAGYDGHSEDDFFRWWVRQEAAGKLSGQGLRLRPIPQPPLCHLDTLEVEDQRYYYCVCAKASEMT